MAATSRRRCKMPLGSAGRLHRRGYAHRPALGVREAAISVVTSTPLPNEIPSTGPASHLLSSAPQRWAVCGDVRAAGAGGMAQGRRRRHRRHRRQGCCLRGRSGAIWATIPTSRRTRHTRNLSTHADVTTRACITRQGWRCQRSSMFHSAKWTMTIEAGVARLEVAWPPNARGFAATRAA